MTTFAQWLNISATELVECTAELARKLNICDICGEILEGNNHTQCEIDRKRGYSAKVLTGRCADGFQRGSGVRYHAVRIGKYTAICGAKPGRRSAGWSCYNGSEVTCPKCLKRLEEE